MFLQSDKNILKSDKNILKFVAKNVMLSYRKVFRTGSDICSGTCLGVCSGTCSGIRILGEILNNYFRIVLLWDFNSENEKLKVVRENTKSTIKL